MRFGGAGRTHWGKVLAEHAPDIFLAQETCTPYEHLPESQYGHLADDVVWSAVADLAWGSAVYIKGQRPRQLELPDFHGYVVGAEVDLPNEERPLRLFSVHAPKRGSYQKAVHAILDMIQDFRDRCDLVIGGDFNLTVGHRHPSETRSTTRKDLAIQTRLRDELRLINCWQTANPDQPLAQTLRWARNKVTPYHCDGIFVPESWESRLKSSTVLAGDDWETMSDHNPVVAEFEPGGLGVAGDEREG